MTSRTESGSWKPSSGETMIISREALENTADALLSEFDKYMKEKYGTGRGDPYGGTYIDILAEEYFALNVRYEKLSPDGSLCGITAYENCEYTVPGCGKIKMRQNDVVLDISFLTPPYVHRLCGKRRFTLAHEFAHQFLHQISCDDEERMSFRKKHSGYIEYSSTRLRSAEDWSEWQANVLAAAILMPRDDIEKAMWMFSPRATVTCFDGSRFPVAEDGQAVDNMARQFCVSKSAMILRLNGLGYLKMYRTPDYSGFLKGWKKIETM